MPYLALLVTTALVLAFVSFGSLRALFVLSSLAVLTQYAVTALSLFRLAHQRKAGLGMLDLALAPLCLFSIIVIARAAEAAELAILGGILVVGFVLLALRQARQS